MAEKGKGLLQLLNLGGVVAMVIVNILANALPLAGKSTGELSDLYPNLFVPAGFTFAVWGLIYLLLALFVFYQARDLGSLNRNPLVEKVGVWFFISCVANMAWVFAWHYERVFLSLLFMGALLASLLIIYTRLGIGGKAASKDEQYLVHLPFSVYLGWISVATIANVAAYLVHTGWGRLGLSEQTWTVLVIVVAAVIALLILQRRRDIIFSLVVVWAFIGILARHAAAEVFRPVLFVVLIAVTALLIVSIILKAQAKAG